MPSVVITGSQRGLGRCLVQKFIEEGWRVFAGARVSAPPPVGASDRLTPLELDVLDWGSVERAARGVAELTPGVDVLINNAAINPSPDSSSVLGELDFDAINRTYDVNAVGPLRVIQAFLPLLERGERKLIINVSSEAGSLQHSWRDRMYGYCMSKAALNMQTTILDRALRERGFNVLAVHPGWMRTDMGGANATLAPEETAEGMFRLIQGANGSTPRFVQHDGKPFPW